MAVVGQILIGLLTTFIGFLLGAAWQMPRRQITYWRARRFRQQTSSKLRCLNPAPLKSHKIVTRPMTSGPRAAIRLAPSGS